MTEEDLVLPIGYKVDSRFLVHKKLGQGAFGAVYEVSDLAKKFIGRKAMKLESIGSPDQVLKVEVMVLKALAKSPHFCQLFTASKNDRFNFMVMELVGPSLSTLRKKAPGKKFSRNTSIILTAQSLQAIKDMHSAGWLHRDVKPSNFAMGSSSEAAKRIVFLLDFGLSRTYITTSNHVRAPRSLVGFRGTLRYCSLNAHKGKELGRSDDLISLLYMMVEMLKSTVPWKELDSNFETGKCKEKSAPTLYDPLPKDFFNLHKYLHTLRYEDTPLYNQFENALAIVVSVEKRKTLQLDWETTGAKQQAPQKTLRGGLESSVTASSAFTQTQQNNMKIKGAAGQDADMMTNVEDLPKSPFKNVINKKKS